MLFALSLFITSALFEALPYYKKRAWSRRKIYAFVAGECVLLACAVVSFDSLVLGLFCLLISMYRLINLARLVTGRLPDQHLMTIGRRSFLVLYTVQVLVILIAVVANLLAIPSTTLLGYLLIIGSFIGACVIFAATLQNVKASKPKSTDHLSDDELPTLTIAIAARNETPTLVSCLETVVASNYPKLEILVLDDDSQDTTAEIIRSFAQDGVRFVKWESIDGNWLSKNRAYETLLQHASGDLLLYMGVDVRLHAMSLRRVVEQMLARNLAMMTLVPKRTKSGLLAIFIQPMRYWWELAIPHAIRMRPPALSTCWIINRRQLENIGGFYSYKRSITPEEHLARYFFQRKEYGFVRTTSEMLITTHKSFFSQWDTQVRTRYPHAHRRPETTLAQTILLVCFVIGPFIALPFSYLGIFDGSLVILLVMSVALYISSHLLISLITNPAAGFFAPLNFPIAIALDIVALHFSMFKYEFSKVIWKGRDVAPKKLHAISQLPIVDEPTRDSENTH